MLPWIPYANIFKENFVIYSIKRFFLSKNSPITMSPESKLFVILSTKVIIACCVECFFTKTELIFVHELFFIHEIKHIIIH